VKVRPEGGSILTTQLYFPMSTGNEKDGLYDPSLLVALQDGPGGFTGTFNFVLNVTGPQPPQPVPPSSSDSYTFAETGITVAGDFWTAWQGSRSYADSVFINGLPITPEREETSPTDGKVYRTQWFERARFEHHPENPAPNNVLLGLLGTVAAQGRQGEAPFARIENPGGGLTYFAQTGHTLGDDSDGGRAIAAAWDRLGGLAQFGYPISQPFTESNTDDGKQYLVQYFERQRFEYHPENAPPNDVLLGLLGTYMVQGRVDGAFARIAGINPGPDLTYFEPVGHSLGGSFLSYWSRYGGLPIFGYPLSEPFEEVSATDGKTYLVQYFERARFEYHPEFAGTPNEVLLGLLGRWYAGR
jgi:hypothetical protein